MVKSIETNKWSEIERQHKANYQVAIEDNG